jgi:hypothetical protein
MTGAPAARPATSRADRSARVSRAGVSRAGVVALVAGAACGLAGCATGDQAADLFAVTRTSTIASQHLPTLLLIPRSDGTVSCNGKRYLMPGPLTIQAEDLQPELESPASHAVTLPSGPNPVLTYSVLTPGGHFSFSDDTPRLPATFKALEDFTYQVAKQVCGLPR